MESLRKLSGSLSRLSSAAPLSENPFDRVSQLTCAEEAAHLEKLSNAPTELINDGVERTG